MKEVPMMSRTHASTPPSAEPRSERVVLTALRDALLMFGVLVLVIVGVAVLLAAIG